MALLVDIMQIKGAAKIMKKLWDKIYPILIVIFLLIFFLGIVYLENCTRFSEYLPKPI